MLHCLHHTYWDAAPQEADLEAFVTVELVVEGRIQGEVH